VTVEGGQDLLAPFGATLGRSRHPEFVQAALRSTRLPNLGTQIVLQGKAKVPAAPKCLQPAHRAPISGPGCPASRFQATLLRDGAVPRWGWEQGNTPSFKYGRRGSSPAFSASLGQASNFTMKCKRFAVVEEQTWI